MEKLMLNTKLINNIVINYAKLLITIIISFFTVPVILTRLGFSDFGIYNLFMGFITLLSFVNSSMAMSSQRYLSVNFNKGHKEIQKIFNISLLLHCILAICFALLLFTMESTLFKYIFNINIERIIASKIVFKIVIAIAILNFLSVPFDSILNSFENFKIIAIFEISYSILYLLIALMLFFFNSDKLVVYSILIFLINFFIFIVKTIYITHKYKLKINFLNNHDKKSIYEIVNFTSWNTLGSLFMLIRNQGMSILVNKFYGTILNTSYGISNQINNILANFSITIQKGINPQLMKNSGINNITEVVNLTYLSSRLSIFITSVIGIPLIFEMNFFLNYWLGKFPLYSIEFSQLIIILTIAYQFSTGLMSAIQAAGRVKRYQILMSNILFLNLPISFFLLKRGYPPYFIFISMILLEIVSFMSRVSFFCKFYNLKKLIVYKEITIQPLIFILNICFLLFLNSYFLDESISRFIFSFLISLIGGILLIYFLFIDYKQRIKLKYKVLTYIRLQK